MNAKLPPGLQDGPHEVRLRTACSTLSHGFSITVGETVATAAPIGAEADGPTPSRLLAVNTLDESNVFRGYRAEYLSCRFINAGTELHQEDVTVEMDGRRLATLVVAHLGESEWQINAVLPREWSPGKHEVRVRTVRGQFSDPAEIFYEPPK